MAASVSAPDPDSAAPLRRLQKRRDFLLAARARKCAAPGFILQARKRREEEAFASPDTIRIGYTASKKVGGAVHRNRAKRRLRALAEPALASLGRPGWDYVLIARAESTANRSFETLQSELRSAIEHVHSGRGAKRSDKGRRHVPKAETRPSK